jgi:hypothetical protein
VGEVSYDKTADDFVEMYRDIFRMNVRRNPIRRVARVGAAVAILATFAWMLDGDGAGAGAPFYGAAIGTVLVVPACWIAAWLLLPRRARTLYAQDRTTDRRWTWQWSAKGLEGSSANTTARYQWSELHHWHDGRHTFLFFLNDAHVLYLPRRHLNEAQAGERRTLAGHAGVSRR